MRILHIRNPAGIGSILAKYQHRLGHEAVFAEQAGRDPYGFSEFYHEYCIESSLSGRKFYRYILSIAKNYDILHIHSVAKLAFFMRLRYPFKKIVLHYHGTEIRQGLTGMTEKLGERLASQVIVATADLQPLVKYNKHIKYLPNPIDIEHFKRIEVTSDKWLAFYHSGEWETNVPDFLKDKTQIVDRSTLNLKYKNMPNFLRKYAGFIDVKIWNGKLLGAFSSTGLQALSMGLPVCDYKGEIHKERKQEHDAENVVKQLY